MPWRAQVQEASFTDAECAALMHGENEWTEGVSALENAAQWKAMLDADVFVNQSALAAAMGCHRGTVSRAVRTVTALLGEPWIERLVRPVMHEFSQRAAGRLADACADASRRQAAKRCARSLHPGVPANSLYGRLFGNGASDGKPRETVFVRRKGRAGGLDESWIRRVRVCRACTTKQPKARARDKDACKRTRTRGAYRHSFSANRTGPTSVAG